MEFDHHRTDVAPFVACLLRGCNWDIKSDDSYKFEVPRFKMTGNQMVEWLSDVRYYHNEGIIISYMDRNNDVKGILDLITEARLKGLSIMIETDREIEDFEAWIGEAVAKDKGYPNQEEDGFYNFLGMSVLDFLIDEEYYIVAGLKRKVYVIDPTKEG